MMVKALLGLAKGHFQKVGELVSIQGFNYL